MYVRIVMLMAGLLMLASPGLAEQEKRVALIIGNSDYQFAPLRNPRNDARDVAKVLDEQLGFETKLVLDADQATLRRAIRDFSQTLEDADVRLFYYAGHGVSVDGANFMIPVGAEIKDEDEVQWEGVNTALVLKTMEKFNTGANVIILDACRDNPLPKSSRSSQRGLDKLVAPLGSLILYATAPGQVALDGTGRNGTFTKHLLRSLAAPNVHIGDIALDVRVAVMQDTNNKQVPWSESSLTKRIYLAGEDQQSNPLELTATVKLNESGTAEGEPVVEAEGSSGNFSNVTGYESSILAAYLGAATSGDAVAQASLGFIYDVGRSVAEDNVKAHAWYEKAVDQQHRDAMVNLGILYLSGEGVSTDNAKAYALFLAAAEAGHPVAQRNLGTLYQFGDVVQKNYNTARMWFEKAADQGHADAFVDLGDLYSRGLGVKRNNEIAFAWYLKAAEQGIPNAQSEVGYFYDQGLGVEQDYRQAFIWFQRAADQDDPTGIYNLGEMHEFGKGTAADLRKAVKNYEKAQMLGNTFAAKALARLENEE